MTGTTINPIAGMVALLAAVLILVLPRQYIIAPLLLTLICMPLAEEVVIGGVHLMVLRLLLVVGWIRLLFSGGRRFEALMNPIDRALVLWVASGVITYSLLWGSWAALTNRLGFLYNAFGIYFLLRYLHRSAADVDRTIKVFAVICTILAVAMLVEQHTGRNPMSVFGALEFPEVREGRLRAQGPFEHSILAGTFGATLVPLFLGLWWKEKKHLWIAALGTISATVITIAAASSTPVLAYVGALAALLLWPVRNRMRTLRWALVVGLVVAQLFMQNPIWHLIARASVVGGSTGWHRYSLVDNFVRRTGEWWLVGTRNNVEWGLNTDDLANQYVKEGIQGGMITLILFLAIIVYCFKKLGAARKRVQGDPVSEKRLWALGAALLAHTMAFIGISYFDQTIVSWYALLTMIVTCSLVAQQREEVPCAGGREEGLGIAPPPAAELSAFRATLRSAECI